MIKFIILFIFSTITFGIYSQNWVKSSDTTSKSIEVLNGSTSLVIHEYYESIALSLKDDRLDGEFRNVVFIINSKEVSKTFLTSGSQNKGSIMFTYELSNEIYFKSLMNSDSIHITILGDEYSKRLEYLFKTEGFKESYNWISGK